MSRIESKEDRIFRQIRQLQLALTNCQDQLSLITDELSTLNLSEPRQISSLTRQFNLMTSPSSFDSNKRRDSKKTPEQIRAEKRRVQPTHLGSLHRSNALLNGENVKPAAATFDEMEQEILERKRNREKQNLDVLATRKPSDYNEVLGYVSEASDDEEELITEVDFTPGYEFKAKGHKGESIKKYISRIWSTAIQHGLQVVNTVKGMKFILNKLQKVQAGFLYSDEELKEAVTNMAKLQALFKRILLFIDSKEKNKGKKTSLRL